MQFVLRQFVIRPAFVAAAAMAMTVPLGCGTRTGMLAVPDDEAPVGSPGGSGDTSSQASSMGGSGGYRPGFGGSSGAGGYIYGTGGSGGYVYATGGSGGSGGSSVRSDLKPYSVAAGGYVTSGTWSGYAWTTTDASGTTISPSDFSGLGDGGRLCVKGVVSDQGVAVFAILGINVAQPQNGGSAGVWTPTGSGLVYSLAVNIASSLRITIQGAAGYPNESWCVNITGRSGEIAWTQFRQYCWATYGSFYDGKTPLESVMFEVPGTNSTKVNYDFCVGNVGPI